jgi:hypothetical protein
MCRQNLVMDFNTRTYNMDNHNSERVGCIVLLLIVEETILERVTALESVANAKTVRHHVVSADVLDVHILGTRSTLVCGTSRAGEEGYAHAKMCKGCGGLD